MLIYYAEDKKLSEEKFWREKGKDYHGAFKQQLKLNDEMKKLAAELTAGLSSDEEKLAAISEWVRKNMKNASYDVDADLNRAERRRLAETRNAAEFFKLRVGYQQELNTVMAALATAAGYEVQLIRIPDRGDVFFAKDFLDTYLLRASAVGVKTAKGWKYYDPGTPWLAPGMLRWEEEGVPALLPDGKEPSFIETPQTPAEGTVVKRTGTLTLDLEGTLAGEVSVEMTGHFATEERESLHGRSEADRTERVKN